VNWFRLKSCIKCQGDLAADTGDWLCLQCGAYYYTGPYHLPSHLDDGPQVSNSSVSEQPQKKLVGVAAAPLVPALGPNLIMAAAMAQTAAL